MFDCVKKQLSICSPHIHTLSLTLSTHRKKLSAAQEAQLYGHPTALPEIHPRTTVAQALFFNRARAFLTTHTEDPLFPTAKKGSRNLLHREFLKC